MPLEGDTASVRSLQQPKSVVDPESPPVESTIGSDQIINEKAGKKKELGGAGDERDEARADVFSVHSSEEIEYRTMSWKKAA